MDSLHYFPIHSITRELRGFSIKKRNNTTDPPQSHHTDYPALLRHQPTTAYPRRPNTPPITLLLLLPRQNNNNNNNKIITHLKAISDAELPDDAILLVTRQRPLEANVTGLYVRRLELVDTSRIGLARRETSAQGVGTSQVIGLSAGAHDQGEGVVAMGLELGYGDAVHRRDVLDVVAVGVYVLDLEGVVLAARRVPGQADLRVVDLRRVDR